MSNARLIVKNTSVLVLGEIISRLLSFFLIILIARYLGEVGLGKYSFAFAFVGIFSILSDFGTNVYMTREVSKDRSLAKEYLGKVFVFRMLAGAIAALLPAIIILFTSQTLEIKLAILLAAIGMFAYYIAFPLRAIVNAYEMQSYQSYYITSERIIAFVLGVFVLYNGYGLLALLIVLVLSNASSLVILYGLISKKIVKLQPQIDIKFLKSLLKKSLPFWFTAVFMTIYFKIGTVMLSFLKDYAATGWYNASYKIIDALSFIPFVIITAIFPAMSKFYKKSDVLLRVLFEKSFYYLLLLALPLGIGTTLLADRIILFVYKQNFINSVAVLQILIWALVFIFVNYLMGYLLNSIDKQKLFTLTTGLSAALNIILNFILIPKYSFIGAAAATVASEFLNFIMFFYFTSKSGFHLNLFKMILKPLIASILMGLFILYFRKFHLLLLVPSSIALYFLLLFLIGGISSDDKKLFLSMIKLR